MATIVIKDLPESMELDRQAMQSIAGGSRFRAGANVAGRASINRPRLFKFPPAGAGNQSQPAIPAPSNQKEK